MFDNFFCDVTFLLQSDARVGQTCLTPGVSDNAVLDSELFGRVCIQFAVFIGCSYHFPYLCLKDFSRSSIFFLYKSSILVTRILTSS